MERKIGFAVVRVERTDIAKLSVDAIVNAANTHLWMGGGVAGAIKRAGGESIEREAVAKGPISKGEAVVTTAGRLPCRYVIHAATMGQDLVTDPQTIRQATHASLEHASQLGLASLAFPALGTGVGGFPLVEAARLMVEEVALQLRGKTSLREVVFAVVSEDAERTFADALQKTVIW